MLKKYFQLDARWILIAIILVELAYNYILKQYVFTDKMLYNSLISELSEEDISQTTNFAKSVSWSFFLLIPASVLLQVFLITLCLNIGALLFRYQITFKSLFNVVIKAFAIFAIAKIVTLSIYLLAGIKTLDDINQLPKLSLYDLTNKETLSQWLVYPLQLLSVFEVAFIFLLAFGLNIVQNKGVRKWIPFVLGTYGAGLIIWAIFVTFMVLL